MKDKINILKKEISKVVIGQENMVDSILIGLFTDGHILIEGVPGLAKTTTVKAISNSLGLNFSRVQFTPDLLPADIIGVEIFDMKNSEFKIKKGPLFTNLLLADEINRAPSKVQSALLEVMQERQITIGNETFKIDDPFLVMATQNPIEQEGAYRLPEAQLDRFMFKILVGYNSKEEELEIADRVALNSFKKIEQIFTKDDIRKVKDEIQNIHIDDEVKKYIIDIIFESRKKNNHIEFGASPRATIDIFKAVKAKAYLRGNDYVSPIDVALIIKDILRHRIILSYEAQAEDISTDKIIEEIMGRVNVP